MAAMKMIQVGEHFLSSLSGVSWSDDVHQGYLFGQVTVDKTIVIGFAKTSQNIKKKLDHTDVSQHLVGGLDICGIIVKPGLGEDPLSAAFAKLVKVILAEKNFLKPNILICLSTGEISSQSFYWLSEDKDIATQAEIEIRDHSILSESLLVRIQTKINLTYLNSKSSITEDIDQEVQKLCSDVRNGGSLTFSIPVAETPTLLMCDETYGMKKNSTASSLLEYLPKLKSSQEVVLSMDVLQRLSNNNIIPTCAPFIQHNIGEENCLMVDLPIDVLCFVPLDMPTKDVNQLICDTISRQIEAMGCNIRDNTHDGKVFLPEAFHYQPPQSDYYLSIIYPKDITDDSLESSRKTLHDVFCLPSNRPLLKRNNKYIFGGEEIPGGYLLNPHTHINIQPLKDSKFYLVQGNYTYHHYMQDNFDDNKWGCAYRSLQTLCSWFRFQGYTERPVPTHKEIQQALVDIGDKDPKFVGSRQWIGSLEVSYCLDNLIGVTSKILSVSAGAELANKGRELAQHFSTQGTPIMIGGGVLAHTILGINFSEVTGDIRFLILDPHYTGGEYIREVIDKGWCGWKGPEFWDQTAMYNMCLPQIPSGAL